MNHLVHSSESLRELRQEPHLRRARSVTVTLPEFSSEENAAHSRALSAQVGSCGCSTGGGVFLGYLAWLSLAGSLGWWPTRSLDLAGVLGLALAAPALAGLAKFSGRELALWRARRAIDQLLATLSTNYSFEQRRLSWKS